MPGKILNPKVRMRPDRFVTHDAVYGATLHNVNDPT